MTLAHARIRQNLVITAIGGFGTFRRRLLELGLLPGTQVKLITVAPLGDPLELEVRGAKLSIRRAEAAAITVEDCPESQSVQHARPRVELETQVQAVGSPL